MSFDVLKDDQGIKLFAQWGGQYFCDETPVGGYEFPLLSTRPGSSCRAYWELFDGVPDDDVIRLLELDLRLGGWMACYYSYFQVSVYGREHLNGPNIVCPYRQIVRRYGSLSVDPQTWPMWHKVPYLSLFFRKSEKVRCVLLKLEAINRFGEPNIDTMMGSRSFADQSGDQDPPPHGVIIKGARVFGYQPQEYSGGRAVVRPQFAIRDIVKPVFPTVTGISSKLELDQLYFKDLPKTRREAVDDVNGMLGRDYFSWADGVLHFQKVDEGTAKVLPIKDPRVTMHLSEEIDTTCSAVRVGYTNRRGRPREVVVHKKAPALGSLVKADYIEAPESVRSKKAAISCGLRYLRDHNATTMSNQVTVRGIPAQFGDALLARPGERVTLTGAAKVRKKLKITRVSLHPLEWSAGLQFEVEPWRFDLWLKRVAGQAHVKR